ncbi:helix-turn-helix transcriptional regulator [Nannocystis punicea]|uniref:Helix-turn-helix transcriptional regulator n=1 Tax=Nannocystis punicea TaxID=2995304 RepID=A0ABY7GWH4_9BACT|nr:helix-turn-helix transcriptional regulator [Nannocystis poenicansa]WAS91311.1 helix-turn-helix transcriptional regulator [Nannocystis poenicansa]
MLTHDALIRLCRARDRLRETDGRAPIAEIAREAGLSPYHFIRQFAAVFGATPHQYRIEARLEQAKRLLALGNHSVTDVCFEVGFESLGSFSDLFSRRVGVAPSMYRRRWQVPSRAGSLPRALIPGCLLLMCGEAALAPAIFKKH